MRCIWSNLRIPFVLIRISTGDLFPGQNPPRKVDEELEHFVVKACEVTGNHPDDLFCLKVWVLSNLGGRFLLPKCTAYTPLLAHLLKCRQYDNTKYSVLLLQPQR